MVKVIAVIGRKKSGKTATSEFLISRLVREGFKVGALKHVHHAGFTLDQKGKDSWRFAQAGGDPVIIVSSNQVAIISKTKDEENIEELLAMFKGRSLDAIVLEGFHRAVAGRTDICKIITAKDENDLQDMLPGTSPPIICITGPIAKKRVKANLQTAILDLPTQGDELLRMIHQATTTLGVD
ncbi:MAG: molybdopterin-guanine dinucleotide biosynthesis protein B [Candidatus Bathyarchaeia archaeon]